MIRQLGSGGKPRPQRRVVLLKVKDPALVGQVLKGLEVRLRSSSSDV